MSHKLIEITGACNRKSDVECGCERGGQNICLWWIPIREFPSTTLFPPAADSHKHRGLPVARLYVVSSLMRELIRRRVDMRSARNFLYPQKPSVRCSILLISALAKITNFFLRILFFWGGFFRREPQFIKEITKITIVVVLPLINKMTKSMIKNVFYMKLLNALNSNMI